MINKMEYIDILINTSISNIKLDDYVNIDIQIINKSHFLLENGLFRLDLSEEVFKLQDENFISCINDYGVIGGVDPNSTINISIPTKVKNLPKDLVSQIQCDVSFNLIKQNLEIEDLSYTSKLYSVFFMEPEIFTKDEFKYYVDKEKVFQNDIINHTIELTNNSNVDVCELVLYNISKSKFEFMQNSIKINGMYQMSENILDGIEVGELDSKESLKIEFQTKTLKSVDDVNLRFCIEYKTRKQKITQKSENIVLKMMYPMINKEDFIKYPNKYNLYIGDIIEFKIEVSNSGNSDATSVIIRDKIDKCLEYLEGTLQVDHTKSNQNIFKDGIKLERLNPKEKKIITYKAKAINISSAKVTEALCLYSNNEGDVPISVKSTSSEVIINGAKIGNNSIKKELSSNHAQVGDIITTRIEVENTGNIDCESIKIYDDINSCIEFITNSLRINGNNLEDEDIYNGISIDRIKPKDKVIITYQIKILDLPKPNPIVDKTTINYTYLYKNSIKSDSISSSKTKLYVYNPNLQIEDRECNGSKNKFCYSDEYVYFSLKLENKGNIGLENIYLRPNFPHGLEIDYNSLKVNNGVYNKIIENKIMLPNLNVSQKMYIDFRVKGIYTQEYDMESILFFEYDFRDLDKKNTYKNMKKANYKITIANPNLELYKVLSQKIVEKNEAFTQSIFIKNTGNIKYKNIKLKLNETDFLESKSKEYILNGKEIAKSKVIYIKELGVEDEARIDINYLLDSIEQYEEIISESELSATYKLFENDEKTINKKSNKIKLKIKNPSLNIEGKCNYNVIFTKDKYTYVYSIYNDGNIDFESLKMNINLPQNIEYINSSFKIDNRLEEIEQICYGIDIGSLKSKHFRNISFDFTVRDMNNDEHITINSSIDALYKMDLNTIDKKFYSIDKELLIENKSLEIIKSASHDYLQKGDILKIQNIINNTGTIDFSNIKLIDNKDPSLSFIKDSVYIDGENIFDINPIDGIYIDKLESYENVLISYEYEYSPKKYNNNIKHFSEIEYSYTLKNSKTKYEKETSKEIYIEAGISTFKEFNIENKYTLNQDEPDIDEIINVSSNARIDKIHEISNRPKREYDEVNTTGKKVVIKGTIMNRLEYLIKEGQSSLYLIERQHPFAISINIPDDYYIEDLDFKIKCEDVFCKINNKRSLYTSTLMSIEGIV